MLGLAAAAIIAPSSAADYLVTRDAFGVPKIEASSPVKAYEGLGYAVAQDRLWQMELARRMATGRMAEIDPALRRTDESTLRTAPTEAGVRRQFAALSEATRNCFEAYAEGVNRAIAERKADGTLPPGYAEAGIEPEPWTPMDSAQIGIVLMRRFGTGGAGELRALALLEYFKTQKVKGRELDVLDDLAWNNDPLSIPTLSPEDDKVKPRPVIFPAWTRAQTLAQWNELPKPNLLELAGAVASVQQDERQLVAARLGIADHWGSYAVVAGPRRSKSGRPILLGAPQMGHSTPSVVHEVALRAPGLQVNGMNVPGIPMIAIGFTPQIAWTLTSGVADIEDIVATRIKDGKLERGELATDEFVRKLRGGGTYTFSRQRTMHGPVILNSPSAGVVMSVRSALHGRELSGVEAVLAIKDFRQGQAGSPLSAAKGAAPSFNVFYAAVDGRIGWRYAGLVPLRAPGFDPRLPLPDRPETDWRGFVPFSQMPSVENPASGLIANWNNKPASWWPNGDTPAWGRFFRNRRLEAALPKGQIGVEDLEMAAWTIARQDYGAPLEFRDALLPYAGGMREDLQAAGWLALEGSVPSATLRAGVAELRKSIFMPWLGGLTSPALFSRAIQPELIMAAWEGRTKFDYFAGRNRSEAALEAMKAVRAGLPFAPSQITVPGEPPVAYNDRGTYIQLVEMAAGGARGRTIASPGTAEAGVHSRDQVRLLRGWQYKPSWPFAQP